MDIDNPKPAAPLIPQIAFSGGVLLNSTPEDALRHGATQAEIDAALAMMQADRRRDELRAVITQKAGDMPSLLGTTSDVAAAALIGLAHIIVLLSAKGTADIKAGLAASPIPLSIDELATRFSARGAWKKRLPQLLEMLVTLGRAQESGGSYSAS